MARKESKQSSQQSHQSSAITEQPTKVSQAQLANEGSKLYKRILHFSIIPSLSQSSQSFYTVKRGADAS